MALVHRQGQGLHTLLANLLWRYGRELAENVRNELEHELARNILQGGQEIGRILQTWTHNAVQSGLQNAREIGSRIQQGISSSLRAGGELNRYVHQWAEELAGTDRQNDWNRALDDMDRDPQLNAIIENTHNHASDIQEFEVDANGNTNMNGSGNTSTNDGTEPPQAMAMRAGGGIGPQGISKETPITPAQPSYGLQETHTTLCNWNGYFSAVGLEHATPVPLEIRLTSPLDMIVTSATADPGLGATWTKGLHVVPFNDAAATSSNANVLFPSTFTVGSYALEKANWFAFWAKIYEYYTVLKCHYKITIINQSSSNGNDAIVGVSFDAYSDTAGSTGNETPKDASLHEVMQWKHMNWHLLTSARGQWQEQNKQIISGTYVAGTTKRNVSNDGDVKTWNLTNAIPTLKENMVLLFYKSPLAHGIGVVGAAITPIGVNIHVELKYEIQFKDLRLQARYPNTNTTDISLTIDTDTRQIPAETS